MPTAMSGFLQANANYNLVSDLATNLLIFFEQYVNFLFFVPDYADMTG